MPLHTRPFRTPTDRRSPHFGPAPARWRLVLLCLALIFGASASAAPPPNLAGDYTGWLYLDVGQDMPIRLHLREDGEGTLSATIDNPVMELGGIPTNITVADDGSITLVNPDVVGFKVTTTLEPVGADTLRGETVWSSEQRTLEGDIWLHRAAVEIPWVPMDAIPDASGVYPIAPGRAIVISRRPWGELMYADTLTGRSGYLLPRSPTEFLAGARMYVATQVAAEATLLVDAGEVEALRWRDAAGDWLHAERTDFVIEPVAFQREGVAFAGEVMRLPGADARPGIVVVGGSDWQSGDGLRRYTQVFASMGMTVLTFDKRGHDGSGGEPDAPFEDIARDILAGAELLSGRSDTLAEQVGVFGYSRAGWHIPLAASLGDGLDFAVMFVPPAVSPASQETTRRMRAVRDLGVEDPVDIALAERYLDTMWRFARSDEGGDELVALRDEITERGWADALGSFDSLDEDEWRWSRANMHYDPIPALRSVTCPMLAIFGSADTNVTPAQNLGPMRDAFAASGVDATCIVLEGADHGLRIVEGDDTIGRFHSALGWSPELWPAVRAWLRERLDLPE